MSGLTLKNINKTFPGDQQAIRDFNLEVKDREFLILVGHYLRQSDDRWNGYDGCGPEREKRRNAFQEQRALSWNECGGQPYILPQNGKDAGCRDREKSG